MDRRMDAYYCGFTPTGSDCIDKILSAVACAGKAYHNTDRWMDETVAYGDHSGNSPVEWVQNGAQEAAQELADAETLIDTQSKALVQGAKREEVLKGKAGRLEAFVQRWFEWRKASPQFAGKIGVTEEWYSLQELAESVSYVTELAPKVMEE